jgi:hypothetical protein
MIFQDQYIANRSPDQITAPANKAQSMQILAGLPVALQQASRRLTRSSWLSWLQSRSLCA